MSVVVQHVGDVSIIEKPVQLTSAAKQRIVSYLAEHQHKGLRISVKKTGCSGLSYVLDYVDECMPTDIVITLEEAYFVSVEKSSYPYIKGVEIDYVKQGINQKFIFNNPNQTGQCGCGESFTVSSDDSENM
ncbi:MAG: iron-sulfur cluster assembly accessory protein [Legionellaceae bacterium]|nr:iron-sulfur cluster assembly accessory protein [Legionellaceae bacterium]